MKFTDKQCNGHITVTLGLRAKSSELFFYHCHRPSLVVPFPHPKLFARQAGSAGLVLSTNPLSLLLSFSGFQKRYTHSSQTGQTLVEAQTSIGSTSRTEFPKTHSQLESSLLNIPHWSCYLNQSPHHQQQQAHPQTVIFLAFLFLSFILHIHIFTYDESSSAIDQSFSFSWTPRKW